MALMPRDRRAASAKSSLIYLSSLSRLVAIDTATGQRGDELVAFIDIEYQNADAAVVDISSSGISSAAVRTIVLIVSRSLRVHFNK